MNEQETNERARRRWHSDDLTTCLQRALHECAELERKGFEAEQRARSDPQVRTAAALEAINERLAQQESAGRPPLAELELAGGVLRTVATEQGKGDAEHVALAAALVRVAAWLEMLAKR